MCGSVFVIRIHKAPEYGSNADPDPQQWLLVFGKENNRIPVPVLGKIPKEWFCFVNIFLYKNCIPVLSKFTSIHDVSSDRVESIPVFQCSRIPESSVPDPPDTFHSSGFGSVSKLGLDPDPTKTNETTNITTNITLSRHLSWSNDDLHVHTVKTKGLGGYFDYNINPQWLLELTR